MPVRIKAKINRKDKQDLNGFEDQIEALCGPLDEGYFIGRYHVPTYEVNKAKGGVKSPQIDIVQVEPTTGEDALTIKTLLEKLYGARTGQSLPPTLPLTMDSPPAEDDPTVHASWPGDADHPTGTGKRPRGA